MSTPNNHNSHGGSVDGKSVDRFGKDGRALTEQEREEIARRKGVCVHCSRKTHEIKGWRRKPLTNDHVHKGLCIWHNLNVVPSEVAEKWRSQFLRPMPTNPGGNAVDPGVAGSTSYLSVDGIGGNTIDAVLAALNGDGLSNNQELPLPNGHVWCEPFDDASTMTDSQWRDMDALDELTEVIERLMEDGNGKVGTYTGKCWIGENTLTGQPLDVPTGQGRMEYTDNTAYDGEWKNGLWHGYGTFTPASDSQTYNGKWMKGKRDGLGCETDSAGNKYIEEWKDDVRFGNGYFTHHSGWTVEGRWEKDQSIKFSSISCLTNAKYKSVCN